MAMFKAFKPSGMEKIARSMGYQGNMQGFQNYLATNPAQQQQMDLYTNKAMQMAKGGYAKKYKAGGAVPPRRVDIKGQDHMLAYITPEEGELLKAHGGSGKPGPMGIPSFEGEGDGPEESSFYYVPVRKPGGSMDEQGVKKVYIGSRQDTMENRMAGSSDLAGNQLAKKVKAVDQDEYMIEYNKRLAELQGRPDPYAAAEQAAAEQAAAEEQAAADAQAAAQAQAAAEQAAQQQAAAAQQQYSQQVAAQMQSGQTQMPTQMPTQPTQPTQTTQPTQPTYVPPIYQAPYLSGTRFTPAGQYVQDPNTGQPVAQAYIPLNQGYGAAATNFQQQIQGVPQAPSLNPTLGEALGGFRGIQGNVSFDPNVASAIGNLAGSVLTQNKGGYVKPQKFAVGGTVTNPSGTQAGTPVVTTPTQAPAGTPGVAQYTVEQMYTPGVPVGGTTIAAQTQTDPRQDIATGTGALTGQVSVPTATATTAQAQGITPTQANVMQAAQAAPAVDAAMNATQAAQANPQDPRAQITAAQQTASSVGNLQAAQGQAQLINNPVQRQIQAGELVTGTGVDAVAAAQATAQTQAAAAQANPSQQAMVQDQLAGLMNQFVGGATPAWASGAIRTANAQMAARGLSASSMAGQAIVQAAMESAMPIAQADAATVAKFESQNLSNRQQSAMLAAEQRAKFLGQEFDQAFQTKVQNASRIADIANQNFTAEQQVQLENSRAANTMNLQNLSNSQALVMSEAAALAQLDVSNLNNRQQVAVQNAQNFLQVDMANLSNQQQTELFKSQQRIQSLFTDQAATNAAAQFNASSQNQVDQFFANLGSQVSQFNATQQNAQAQFNAGQTNTVNRFNAELNNQRDQFNAQNQLVIAQSNAQWRRQIATADTAAVNRANELNANAILDISKQAYSNLWNYYSDTMEWAWTSAENEIDRNNALAIAELDADTRSKVAAEGASSAAGNAVGSLIGTLGSAWIMGGGLCWVAREVYGKQNVQWFIFRTWLQYDAPKWFKTLYMTHGENYAKLISKVSPLKWATKKLMDMVVEKKKRKHYVSCAY